MMRYAKVLFYGGIVWLLSCPACPVDGETIDGETIDGETAVAARTASHATEWVRAHLVELREFYRVLHAHPELSYEEKQTAARMAEQFRELGAVVTTDVGGHGVVGVIENAAGPTLMLRCDLDALPITEATNLVYASEVQVTTDEGSQVGVMHACGHDLHMTNLLGTGRFLAEHKDLWSGTLVLVAQPAEERGAGAQAMLSDGLFHRFPRPDYALALHVAASMPAGMVGYRAGYALANVDSVDITVRGRGGHGAFPHTTSDPIAQAAQLILALQTIVSREIKPVDPAVITVGSIHGGTKHNVIPDECHLQLTVRSYSDKVRNHLQAAIRRKAKAMADSMGAPEPLIEISEGTPSVWNDHDLVARVVPRFRAAIGADRVIEVEQTMGGEDFSQYGKAGVPIFMFWLGSVDPLRLERFRQLGQEPPSLHSAEYYPAAEEALVTGISCMTAAALELLQPE